MLVDSIKHREIPEQKWFEKVHCKVVVQRKAFVQVKCGGGVTQRKWFLNLFSLWNIKDDSLCRQKKTTTTIQNKQILSQWVPNFIEFSYERFSHTALYLTLRENLFSTRY